MLVRDLLQKMVLDETFKQEKKIIFLEDDTFPDISFFKYCSLMLKKYQSNESIYHISGCNLYSGLTQKKISKQNIFLS